MEPGGDKARWFRGRREVELTKCGFSEDCDGWRVAASGNEVLRPHGKEWRERIEVTRMCDDAGQQRLRTVEERRVPAASPARVEVAQESPNPEMTEACVTNNAENINQAPDCGISGRFDGGDQSNGGR